MVITMNDSKLSSIIEIKRFLKESHVIEFKKRFRKEAYEWIEEALEKFDYLYLSKKEKDLIKKYIEKATGYFQPQVTRKIKEYKETGQVRLKEYKRNKFEKKYRYQDYMTPYEKLRSISNARVYLKEGVTFEMLDKIARRYTDNEMAKKVQLERNKLFDKILAA